jgi:2-keto-4-pentenoate hydratase/2-oxohepta-3-ene-1,7-dioic acid hydratase in catechol pathway
MRLVRYVTGGEPSPRIGRLEGGLVQPLDAATVLDGPHAAPVGAPVATKRLRLLAPVEPAAIVCVGRNYRDHVGEKGMAAPAEPLLFAKLPNALIGPGEPIVRPASTRELDLECELAVVIGARARRLQPAQAAAAIFGYTILNDVSARDHQRTDGQWLRAKSSDSFAPIGPCVVTADELGSTPDLRISSSVNGEPWQDSTTRQMIVDVPALLAFISASITLEPGDVVATGTPAGVGHYQVPPRYLQPGDLVRCEIEGIGVLENPVAG